MEYSSINTLIYETIEQIAPLSTSKVSMFDINHINSHPPFLRFKFKNRSLDDSIYAKIKDVIYNFQGNLKWRIQTSASTGNAIIMPSFTDDENEDMFLNQKNYFISILGEELYNKKIDSAIKDIPEIARSLSSIQP